jgi:uncharacterized protein
MRGIELLKDANVQGGELLVITKESLAHVQDIYDFCKEHIKNFDIIPCFHVDKKTGSPLPPTINDEEYGEFLIQLFDLWVQDDNPSVKIRFFEETIQAMMGAKPSLCSLNNGCNTFITVDWNGDIFPCDNFSGYKQFLLGNVWDVSIDEMLLEDNYQEVAKGMSTVGAQCLECKWKNICNGGCSHQRYIPNFNFNSRFYYCDARKFLFAHIQKWLKNVN